MLRRILVICDLPNESASSSTANALVGKLQAGTAERLTRDPFAAHPRRHHRAARRGFQRHTRPGNRAWPPAPARNRRRAADIPRTAAGIRDRPATARRARRCCADISAASCVAQGRASSAARRVGSAVNQARQSTPPQSPPIEKPSSPVLHRIQARCIPAVRQPPHGETAGKALCSVMTLSKDGRNEETERAALKELHDLRHEGAELGGALSAMAKRTATHFAGQAGRWRIERDPIELWGKRIGRGAELDRFCRARDLSLCDLLLK